MDFPASHVSLLEGCFTILFLPTTWWPMIYLVTHVFATGVINDPVEFAIFAYVDTWEGLGGWVGDDDVSITSTHVTCYAHEVSCTFTHVTCYASHG